MENQLSDAKDELKTVKKRKIKEIAKADEDTVEIIEETYADIDNLLKVGVVTTFYYQQVEGREQLLSVAEEMNYGTSVNFNQDSKVISNKMESPDTHNNSTKSCVGDLLTTTVPLKTRNKPERLLLSMLSVVATLHKYSLYKTLNLCYSVSYERYS